MSGFVTIAPTTPAPAFVVQVIVVELTTVMLAAGYGPNCTIMPPLVAKLVPVMVTAVPPAAGPLVGEIELIVGAGAPPV